MKKFIVMFLVSISLNSFASEVIRLDESNILNIDTSLISEYSGSQFKAVHTIVITTTGHKVIKLVDVNFDRSKEQAENGAAYAGGYDLIKLNSIRLGTVSVITSNDSLACVSEYLDVALDSNGKFMNKSYGKILTKCN